MIISHYFCLKVESLYARIIVQYLIFLHQCPYLIMWRVTFENNCLYIRIMERWLL